MKDIDIFKLTVKVFALIVIGIGTFVAVASLLWLAVALLIQSGSRSLTDLLPGLVFLTVIWLGFVSLYIALKIKDKK